MAKNDTKSRRDGRNYPFRALLEPPPPFPKLNPQGPPSKQSSANAIAATASGNSNPPVPISPFLKCTFQMATAISITMASEKKRVNNPSTIAIPPKNRSEEHTSELQ